MITRFPETWFINIHQIHHYGLLILSPHSGAYNVNSLPFVGWLCLDLFQSWHTIVNWCQIQIISVSSKDDLGVIEPVEEVMDGGDKMVKHLPLPSAPRRIVKDPKNDNLDVTLLWSLCTLFDFKIARDNYRDLLDGDLGDIKDQRDPPTSSRLSIETD